jgi:hypothetical protein
MAPGNKSKEAEKDKLTRIALVSDDKVSQSYFPCLVVEVIDNGNRY